jgi:hypothetical protein
MYRKYGQQQALETLGITKTALSPERFINIMYGMVPGAVIGAGMGALTADEHRAKSALIGALLGAGSGGLIGARPRLHTGAGSMPTHAAKSFIYGSGAGALSGLGAGVGDRLKTQPRK